MEKLSKTKKVLILLGICAAVFIILDFNYFWANLKLIFHGQKQSYRSAVQAPAVQEKMEPNLLIIDSLGISVPVVYVDQANETVFQAALVNGVVHYPGTANPGQLGNCYIFGHSSDYIWSKGHYKSIFAVLPSISKGAEIIISDSQGNKFTYIVTDSHEVAANDVSVLSQQDYKKKLLTVQTSYPVGTALARWVAIAEMQ